MKHIGLNYGLRKGVYMRTNRKPCEFCGTTDINKKLPQEYFKGKAVWRESCVDCWDKVTPEDNIR